jgi:DNA helicase-2/ATP-dependent DNA helicase PcrA
MARLQFFENPRDRVAGFRIIQLLPPVGPTSAQRVLDSMAAQPDPIAALSRIPTPPVIEEIAAQQDGCPPS